MDTLDKPPLLGRLEGARHVLVAGAGGGFDVYAALPLGLWLLRRGVEVTWANLTFTYLGGTSPRWLAPGLAEVNAQTVGGQGYFPERTLARWLVEHGTPGPVYALEKTGARPLRAAYEVLCERRGCDAVLLVDGGTDLLVFGDEAGLGSPEEDLVSLAALAALPLATKLGACIGFGVDAYHGICHAHTLENLATLERDGGYLGAFSVPRSTPEGRAFLAAVAHANENTPTRPSIVNGSIAAALEGHFGAVALNDRTASSELFINPLMSLYFGFTLEALARRSQLLAAVTHTETIWEVSAAIEAVRKNLPRRPRRPLPH